MLFSEGVPEERAWLIPDNENALKGKAWIARWDFSTSDDIWITCRYRETTVMVSKKLPPGIKACFVSVDKTKGIQVQHVWCNS